jgi:rhodanese-related sulfurtransferase
MLVQQIDSLTAFEILKNDQNSILIDVRTPEEFNLVGVVDASIFNNKMILLPWQSYQDGQQNPDFLSILQTQLNKFFNKNTIDISLIFICRSGTRSNYSANYLANHGYKKCFNIIDGFEGKMNSNNQRSMINGWKYNNLPWRQ